MSSAIPSFSQMLASAGSAAIGDLPVVKMRTICVLQPWAWLIFRPDIVDPEARAAAYAAGQIKDVENRTWSTKFRGRILIHAAQKYSRTQHAVDKTYFRRQYGIELPAFEDLPRGGIVGMVTLADCVQEHPSPWKMEGHYGFVLKDAVPVPFVPHKGQQGWFSVPWPKQTEGEGA